MASPKTVTMGGGGVSLLQIIFNANTLVEDGMIGGLYFNDAANDAWQDMAGVALQCLT